MSYIVAIDGPAGAGKSTVAKRLAEILNCAYLDTGAMYRALTLKALRQKVNLEDEDALVNLARETTICLRHDPVKGGRVFLDGEDVSEEIRTPEVTNQTFYIARAPRVRQIMVEWQREIGETQDIVAEGRDVTTVVFPEASYKFYLDADLKERSRRRLLELKAKGMEMPEERMEDEIRQRDQRDFSRPVGPLKRSADAIVIDSTGLSVDEVVAKMKEYIQR